MVVYMLILASASPRRFEILSHVNTDFEVVVSNFEEIINPLLPPEIIVQDLALGKGREVLGRYPEELIICGDTIVYFDKKPVGKAKSKDDAFEMLQQMSGKEVFIFTGNGILSKSQIIFQTTVAVTKFEKISDEFIEDYLSDPEADWIDKAGAFAIQGKAKNFTETTGELETALGLSKKFLLQNLLKFEQYN
jgi:MAF protein